MLSFNEALEIVNQKINAVVYPEKPQNLYAPIQYILTLKGKKVRPVLTLLSCNLYKEDISDAISPALVWEIFHNFTLMHDDLMDKAEVRRGKPVVYKVWDENTAILSGDAMLILSYQYIADISSDKLKPVLDLFSKTAMEICVGQQYDMDFEKRLDVSVDEYIEMIRLKTAVLLGAALKTGAIIGGAMPSDAEKLYDFGMNIGLAFQIKDDLLDVYGDPDVFGKQIGGDILCNKKTFLLINALNLVCGADKEILLQQITSESIAPETKIKTVTDIYNRLNLRAIAESKMDVFYQKALNSLHSVQVDDCKKTVLADFARDLMKRES
ncbi:MAG: polyprenyl synthetase family protein [Dysgonamonadaceae bacterium]|nr:polyprenyl synthetase family protein [Dysgonamonadaceae bacterium]